MKRFRAFAIRKDQKYTGTFPATDSQEARQKLTDQGYEILSIEEIRSRRPLAITLLVVALLSGLMILWLTIPREPDKEVVSRTSRQHSKTPVDILGKQTRLKGGSYMIALSEQTFMQAVRYKNAHDAKNLDQMFARNEAGRTGQFGAGQKVRVLTWHDAEHAFEIRFEDTGVTAWVEEKAVL